MPPLMLVERYWVTKSQGFQPVKFFEVVLRFAGLQWVHRLEAYATFDAR